jgi:PAS domain S-box-containing protein/putative nucleotidyltransferase with HDIG domain
MQIQTNVLKLWLPPLLLAGISLLGLQAGYLVFHVLVEFMSMLIAFMAVIITLTSRKFTRNYYLDFISIVIGWCAGVDLVHTMSYKGMDLLVHDNGNIGIQLWLVARYLQAIGFLIAPLFLIRPLSLWRANLFIGAMVGAGLWGIVSGHFPQALSPEHGLTPFKIWSEYIIVGLLLLALGHLQYRKSAASPDLVRYMTYAIVAMIASELAFTQYAAVDDRINLLGHLAKIFAYWFIYVALVQKTLVEPFDQITRTASTYDAVTDPTLIVDRTGAIIQANKAAALVTGRSMEKLVGASSHELFHRKSEAAQDCVVCQQLKTTKQGYMTTLELGDGIAPRPTEFRVSLLPFPGVEEAFVEVIRDIGKDLEIANLQVLKARSEERFQEIFEDSPTPMQIYSIASNKIVRVNKAFTDWLGYTIEDIADADTWFECAYPDPVQRDAIKAQWPDYIRSAQSHGEVVRSPELELQAKSGRRHIVMGSMTADTDDAIVTWVDLTDIRKAERALEASEHHFRNMIEQAAVGIYVRRGSKFIYANPNFLQMLGYAESDVIDKDVHSFTTSDPVNLKTIHEAWAALDQGVDSVTYTVPLRNKNGEFITAELHARVIDWDGTPAHIVLVNDITERQRQQDKIAAYTAQLERSMVSTLEAISKMVEMRDPYTAGHERRVGQIARDIAVEMGWPEEKAEPLKMIGLVHDIGKISVPAEILTKPTRLNELEMQMVRTHAQAGYEILKDVDFPLPVAKIIHQHHERLDGSGYPQGLKGDAILPEARILAVADVFESMCTHRPYRPARGIDEAVTEIVNKRGTLYDPEACDALIRLIKDKGYEVPV